MRKSRLRKFKSKYHGFWLIAKIAMIWYLLLFSGFYFTSNTSALFSDQLGANGKIEADFWPADYELVFTEKGNSNFDVCKPFEITRIIKNNGPEDMNQPALYEVYFIENGNPQKGKKVGEGTIRILNKDEYTELRFLAENPGRYAFVAKYQTEDHQESWSKEIKIDCGSGQNPNKEEQKNKENDKVKNEQNQNVINEDNQPTQEKATEQIIIDDNSDSNEAVRKQDPQLEENTEKSAEPEQTTKKPIEQKPLEEQKPVEEQNPKKAVNKSEIETKPEVEGNPEQENEEGEQ